MSDLIKRVFANVRMEEGPITLEKMLTEVYLSAGIATKELARRLLLPVPLVAAIKREFIKEGALVQDRGVRLGEAGREFVEEVMGFRGLDVQLYRALVSEPDGGAEVLAAELALLEEVFSKRPRVDVTIDQSKCTPETSLKRALLALRNHSLVGKKVLCVGDDDLVSISLGLLIKRLFPGRDALPAEIQVLDIDRRFLEYIETTAAAHGLPIACSQVDLRQSLPPALQQYFDCFFTDPPYTLSGLELFLDRGIAALKQAPGLYIFLSFAHKSPEFTLKMQGRLVAMQLAAEAIYPRFNSYEGAEIIGNQGQMLVLRTTRNTKSILPEEKEGPIYTGEVARSLRRYQCRNCGREYRVGVEGEFTTIEELKERKCSECGHDVFRLVERIVAPRPSRE